MSLAYKVAAPVAVFAAFAGFLISLFRIFRRVPAER
jgi:hypothetical protein